MTLLTYILWGLTVAVAFALGMLAMSLPQKPKDDE